MKFLIATVLTFSFCLAHADHHEGPADKGMMKKMDTDGDGKVSKVEFMKAHETRFAEMDANKDGFLTKDEKMAHHQIKKETRKAKKTTKNK